MNQEKNELRILAETQHAFTSWRLKRKGGEPIPRQLWEKALALVSRYTVSKVAGALRLNSTELKRRAIEAGFVLEPGKSGRKQAEKPSEPGQSDPTFVEVVLPASQSESAADPEKKADTSNGWRIHLTRQDGSRLEILPPAFSEVQMETLVRGFLGG